MIAINLFIDLVKYESEIMDLLGEFNKNTGYVDD